MSKPGKKDGKWVNRWSASPSCCCLGPGRCRPVCCWSACSPRLGWSGCSGGRVARLCRAQCLWSHLWKFCTGEFRCRRQRHGTKRKATKHHEKGYKLKWRMKTIYSSERNIHTHKKRKMRSLLNWKDNRILLTLAIWSFIHSFYHLLLSLTFASRQFTWREKNQVTQMIHSQT